MFMDTQKHSPYATTVKTAGDNIDPLRSFCFWQVLILSPLMFDSFPWKPTSVL